MKTLTQIKQSFSLRLLLYMIALLLLSGLTIAVPSYYIAKSELDHKGEMILKNSVESAIQLIEAKEEAVKRGEISLQEAQEQVKVTLLGPKLADGTRDITSTVDLGDDGYFVVYSLTGTEIMHPTLEGQNVWNVRSKGKNNYLLVQDQITKAKSGGGFSYYSWELPHSTQIGDKVSYAKFNEDWQWVVVATAYLKAYNQGASDIIKVMVAMTLLLLMIGGTLSYRYVKAATNPIKLVASAMSEAEKGKYKPVCNDARADEIGQLVTGFNRMVSAIDEAYQDIKAQQQKADYYAYYDNKSGLPNMNKLREHVTERLAEPKVKGQLVLLQVDVYENLVNLYGNEYAESLMCQLGNFIGKYQEGSNQIARVSANEFAGWIEQWSESQLMDQLRELRRVLDLEIENWGFGRLIDYSIGFSKYPKDGQSFETCYQMAAIALMHAKQSPQRVLGFETTHYKRIEEEARMTEAAEAELETTCFYPVYQGKFNERNQRFVGVEALARWQSKSFGRVGPGEFIPLLTKAGLMNRLSEHMLNAVIADIPKLKAVYGPEVTASVNIPHEFFYREDLTELVDDILSRHGVLPESLVLEITEDTFIQSTQFIAEQVNALRAMGVKVSLDDFGTGYSSLNYLTKIQFDEIKIDKSFIDDLSDDAKARELLRHIVNLAETFNASVVAEGVETKEQVAIIQEAGCHIIQGYVYSKPKPL